MLYISSGCCVERFGVQHVLFVCSTTEVDCYQAVRYLMLKPASQMNQMVAVSRLIDSGPKWLENVCRPKLRALWIKSELNRHLKRVRANGVSIFLCSCIG